MSKIFHVVTEVEVYMSSSSVLIISLKVLRKPVCQLKYFFILYRPLPLWVHESRNVQNIIIIIPWVRDGKSRSEEGEEAHFFLACHAELIDKHNSNRVFSPEPRFPFLYVWPQETDTGFTSVTKRFLLFCCKMFIHSGCFRDKNFVT